MSKAVVLHSGGIDSTVVLAQVLEQQETEVTTISFRYGQLHANMELTAAFNIGEYYGIEHRIINVPLFRGKSALMGVAEMPRMTYEELAHAEGPSPTYVPFRNGTFMSLAAAFALEVEAEMIYTGVHAEDARNWAYPDCTPEFVGAMANAIYVGTYHKVRLAAPLQYMQKWEIVEKGLKLKVPFQLTVSCYEGGLVACGKCPTCVARLSAFEINEADDPIEYAEGVMQ